MQLRNFLIKFLLIIFPLFVISIFDFKNVTYDSESDYIGSALNLLENGEVLNKVHPGNITQFIITIPLIFSNLFDFSVEITIHLSRVFLLFISIIVLYFTFKNLNFKNKNFIFFLYLYLLSIIVFPSTNMLFRQISAEILLIPFSLLFLSLFKNENKDIKNSIILGLIAGICLNIKFTFIVILFLVLSNKLIISYFRKNILYCLRDIFFILFFSLILFLIIFYFSYSELPLSFISLFSNILFSIIEKLNYLWKLKIVENYLIIIMIFLLLILYLATKLYNSNQLIVCKSFEFLSKFFDNYFLIIISIIYPIYSVFFNFNFEFYQQEGISTYENFAINHRHKIIFFIILFFSFSKFFLEANILNNKKKNDLINVLFLILFCSIAFVTTDRDIMYKKTLTSMDKVILDLKKENQDSKIIIYFDNNFDSIVSFANWTNIKYGNCNIDYLNKSFYSNYPEIIFKNVFYYGRNNKVLNRPDLKSDNSFSFISCVNDIVTLTSKCKFYNENKDLIYFINYSKYQKKYERENIQNIVLSSAKTCKKNYLSQKTNISKFIDIIKIY
tara:strand:- start:3878 stop:5551 length:1674 start_codon:yes stop_codon:yes gene_type:complete